MRIKQIPGHPNYGVSDTGSVFAIKDKGLKELEKDISTGYPRVTLDGHKYYVSTLVASCFLDSPNEENQKIFLIDGNKLNCDVNNLVWLSPSEIQRYSQFTVEYRREILGEW